MKLKALVKVLVVSCGILGLAACSSTNKNGDASGADGGPAGGAQAFGAGDNNRFGTNGMTPEQLLAKRTYYFEYDKSDVSDQEKPAIFANAENLVAHPNMKVLLEGHTDPRGSREYNVALGEHRANAVAEIMKSKGVNPDQIRVISYGAERLAVTGHSESDYEQDRRVVLVILQH
jgi:peptidoglycan-associated lipoprotein